MTSSVALSFEEVSKKFRKGERHDSLRDLIPAAVRRLLWKRPEKDLSVQEFWAVKDLSFEISRGEAVGIIGPNGSGKSTTLKLLSRILKPNKGKICVNGRLSALIEVAAGFHPDLTGRENVYLNGAILGMRKAEIDRKFDEIVDFSGLEAFIDTPVKRYSSGMHARLGFSVAAHVNPEILLVDEVLSVGDMSFQQRCLEKMQEKIRSDVAVILVSHNLSAVSTLCSRAILLDQGEMIVDGSCAKAVEGYFKALQKWNAKSPDGNTSLRIVEPRFTSEEGESGIVVQPHAVCELAMKLQCDTPLRAFNIGFMIYRSQDMFCCYGSTTEELGYPLFELAPGECQTVRFQFDAHLARGQYRIDILVRDPIGGKSLLRADGVATFMVEERVTSKALANVALRAFVEKNKVASPENLAAVVA